MLFATGVGVLFGGGVKGLRVDVDDEVLVVRLMLGGSSALVGWVGGACCAQSVELVDVDVDANAAVLVVLLRGLRLQLGRMVLKL